MMIPATMMARGRHALKRGAELVGGLLLAAMFGAFLLQVFTRYVLHRPLDWTLEVCLITYVWFVFWACAFLLRERDHVAFGLLYQSVRPPVRRLFALISAATMAGLFLAALPATWEFIAFMARDRTWVLGLRFDLVFGVFLVFMLTVIARSVRSLGRLLGRDWREHL
jgi:TRAP-type C4-dicarboxylate transport system permease small subunit